MLRQVKHDNVRLRLGTLEITDVELVESINRDERGIEQSDVLIPIDSVSGETVDYTSQASLRIGAGGTRDTSLSGFVDTATTEGERLRLRIVSGTTTLAEQQTGGVDPSLFVHPSNVWWARELVWTMLRMGG